MPEGLHKKGRTAGASQPEKLSELALKRPGVKEVMDVYTKYYEVTRGYRKYREMTVRKQSVSTTNRTS